MRVTRLNPDPADGDPRLAVALMGAIGAPAFAERMLACVAAALPSSHCNVFGLRANGRTETVSTASALGEAAIMTADEYLRQGFDRKDSNTLWLIKRKPGRERQFWMGHQFAHEVADAHYRLLCYDSLGLRERLSLLAVFPDGYRVSVSLLRSHAYPDFGAADMAWLSAQAPLIAAAVMRHVELTPLARADQGLARDLLPGLPARERELLAHVLAGLSTREAAQAMGIALSTALTYRYRAFHRLGIRNQRELLGLRGVGEKMLLQKQ
ncbi:MAG TPA: LuxR C-terminal-related transcriptional regulator [Burkholderiaceae bacterium]|nr:LuxR C-terminal-related transcriptional regulator [Burkholderiaceae bacterium]